MKSYTRQLPEQPNTDVSSAEEIFARPKKWKIFLAILASTAAIFLIHKLQQTPPVKAAVQASVVPSKPVAEKPVVTDAPKPIKQIMAKKEKPDPSRLIKADISKRKNLVGETILNCSLTNTSAQVDFKDPVIVINWLSKTNTLLRTDRHTLYEYLGAGKSLQHKIKVKAPAKYAEVRAEIESASVNP